MLFLKRQGFRLRLQQSALILWQRLNATTYIGEGRHLDETHVLRSIDERFLGCGKDAAFEVRGAFVAVDQDVRFAEVGFAAAVEFFVGIGKLVEIGGGFGSLGIG